MSYPVSDAYLEAISQSHQAFGIAQVCRVSGDVIAEIPVRSGTVEADASRSVMRTCRIDLLDDDGIWVPKNAGDLLHPWSGNELRLYRSTTLVDGTAEIIPQGVYRLGAPSVTRGAYGAEISFDAYDRARRVAANAWSYSHTTYPKTITTALTDALADRFPELPTSIEVSAAQAPYLWWYPGMKDDPWRNICDLATAVGWQLYIDRVGVAVAKPKVADHGVVREWVEGPTCTVTSVARQLPAADGPNGVIAVGGDIRSSFRVEAWVEDPLHPLWRGGPYGEVAEVLNESFPTKADAQAAVDARVAELQTGIVGVTVDAVPDAALDPNDTIRLTAPSEGIDGLFTIQTIKCPVVGGTMTVDLKVA